MSRTLTFPRNRAVVALFIRDVTSRFDLGQQVSLRPASSYVCVCVCAAAFRMGHCGRWEAESSRYDSQGA